jgi:hypothetical protein
MVSSHLLMAIAATAELCGKVYTPAAARMLAEDLDGYDEHAVLMALTRCRKELDGRPFNVAAVIARIDDGRPGVEEAWAMLPVSESATVVWTDEMRAAWAVALPLLEDGERISARMAFKEHYVAAVTRARDRKERAAWSASIGTDKHEAERVLSAAVEQGRLAGPHVAGLIAHSRPAQPAPAVAALLTPKLIGTPS